MRLILDIALTHITGRGRQTIVAMLGVAVGVGFSIAMAALMQGGQDDFVRQLVDTMPHVQVTDEQRTARRQPAEDLFSAAAISGLRPRDDRRGIINPTAALSWLDGWIPGRFAATLRAQGVLRYSGQEVGAAVIGIDPQAEPRVSPIIGDFRAGSFAALAAGGNNVVIGDTMASRLGAKIGDTITAVSSEGLSRRFKIVGLFHTGTTARDEGEAYVLQKNAQILSARPNAINVINIKLDDPNAAPTVARRIEAELGYKAIAWQEANESILEALVVRNVIMYTVVAAIMLVAGFGIFNIISTITHEKRQDIAIMKSLGMREYAVRRIFIIEAAIIGLVGILFGWMLGYLLCYGWSKITIFNPLTGTTVPLSIHYSLTHYVVVGGISLLCCAGAAYFPARKATRVQPVEIIRGAS